MGACAKILCLAFLCFQIVSSSTFSMEEYTDWIDNLTTINFLGISATVEDNYKSTFGEIYAIRLSPAEDADVWGSPYDSFFRSISHLPTVARMALPSEAVFESIKDNHLKMILVYFNVAFKNYSPVTRNGYTSKAFSNSVGTALNYIIYYDITDQKIYAYVNTALDEYALGSTIDLFANPDPIPLTVVNRRLSIQDASNDATGTTLTFQWVNFSSNAFISDEGSLSIDNTAKCIYDIQDDSVIKSNSGSTGLEKRFDQYILDTSMTNAKLKNYVAWNIDVDTGFCNCANPSFIGNGIGKAKVKFFHCSDAAKLFFDFIGILYPTQSRILRANEEITSFLHGSSSIFSNENQMTGFFSGKILAEWILACENACSD